MALLDGDVIALLMETPWPGLNGNVIAQLEGNAVAPFDGNVMARLVRATRRATASARGGPDEPGHDGVAMIEGTMIGSTMIGSTMTGAQ
jgi:hypothetical protein